MLRRRWGLIQSARCKNYQLATLFPARTVALGVVWTVLAETGLKMEREVGEWVKDIGSRKVDVEDFEDVVEVLKKT